MREPAAVLTIDQRARSVHLVTLASPPLPRAASSAGVGSAVLLAAAPASPSAASERFRCDSLTAEGHKATDFLNGLPGAAARTSEPAGRAQQTGEVPGGIQLVALPITAPVRGGPAQQQHIAQADTDQDPDHFRTSPRQGTAPTGVSACQHECSSCTTSRRRTFLRLQPQPHDSMTTFTVTRLRLPNTTVTCGNTPHRRIRPGFAPEASGKGPEGVGRCACQKTHPSWWGIDPVPERGCSTWTDFPRSQADAVPACDFFEAVALSGARLYVFAVIGHAGRRIRVLGATAHPTASWVAQAAGNLVTVLKDAGCRARFMIRDRVGKYPALFGPVLEDAGIEVVLSGIRMPRMNPLMGTPGADLPTRTAGRHPGLEPAPPAPRPERVRTARQLPPAPPRHRRRRPLHVLPPPITDSEQLTHLDIRRRDHLGGTLHEYQHAA